MGLFGGSKSSSATTNYNQAQTLDLSSNGLGGGAQGNVIMGADAKYNYNIDGLSEEIINSAFNGFNSGFSQLVELAGSIFKSNQDLTQQNINANSHNMQNLASVYGEAYGTQKSQAESLKTYAFYMLVGVIVVSFIKRAR